VITHYGGEIFGIMRGIIIVMIAGNHEIQREKIPTIGYGLQLAEG